MAALNIKQKNIDELEEQLDMCHGVTGKLRTIMEDFLYTEDIYTLEDVDEWVADDYQEYVEQMRGISAQKRKYYRGLLDQVLLSYLMYQNTKLVLQAKAVIQDRAIRNKVLLFLMEHEITDCDDIDYDIRFQYETFLISSGCKKVSEYVKSIDLLKLESVKQDNKLNPLKQKNLVYANEKIFLLYHPDYELGMTFYFTKDKEELLFDFSLGTSVVLKRQIFKMLCYVLENKENWHDRRERFLIPLKKLYMYCVEIGIEDVELITDKQIQSFRYTMAGKVGTKTDIYMQIVYNITKYLFLSAKNTNWAANMWYLERFNFCDGRANPARIIDRITFGQIEEDVNRNALKSYMKYQIGIAQKTALQTVRSQYYDIVLFFKYCDERRWKVTEIDTDQIEQYIASVDAEDIQASTYNRRIISVARLFIYMKSKGQIIKVPIQFEYYLKTTYQKHNNRTVSIEHQQEVLSKLKYLPLHLRLMFLNLWCEGIRECEVCAIKAGMYIWDGKDAWIKLYQNKMKKEKYIPIPTELYKLMKKYIETNHIRSDEYVFKNKRGGAYDAGTFSVQMKRELKMAGLTNYKFRSHDFRHTVGTTLNKDFGVSIEVIRDYLGHNSTDMTKQYLDFVPEINDKANTKYFSDENNNLVKNIHKGKEEKDGRENFS